MASCASALLAVSAVRLCSAIAASAVVAAASGDSLVVSAGRIRASPPIATPVAPAAINAAAESRDRVLRASDARPLSGRQSVLLGRAELTFCELCQTRRRAPVVHRFRHPVETTIIVQYEYKYTRKSVSDIGAMKRRELHTALVAGVQRRAPAAGGAGDGSRSASWSRCRVAR